MFVTVKNRTKLTGICIRVGQSAATISYQFSNPRSDRFFFFSSYTNLRHKAVTTSSELEFRI